MDLLSSLPDEVRCHVLSFLTTKEAASTSLLSKKWRNLFALVPQLDFDDSEFLHPEDGKRERDGIIESFMDFVDRVLSLQGNSPIRKFSLKCETGVSPARLNRWLCEVLQRDVLDLDLTIDLGYGYYLPQELFVSETLVNLKLKSAFGIHWWTGAEGTSLPMLKSLCVYSGRVFCDDKLQVLLPSFPVLEDLQMSNIQWIDSDDTVSSATLTTLHITGFRAQNPKSISFDTPNLRSFVYTDFVAEDYPLVNMKNLTFARIALRTNGDQIKQVRLPNNDRNFGNVVKLMNGIQNVQELHLCPDTVELLSLCCESMPVFNNVKKLLIYSDEARGWQAVPVLLKNCPHLEILIFEGLVHHVTDKCGDACDCIYRKEKGSSLRSCPVKVVEIKGFGVTMKEKHMIEHFLDYFSCLKEMKIYVEEDGITQIMNNPEVSKLVLDEMEEYDEMYSCNVKLYLDKKSIRNL
ncbi:PREDICTED: F-box protein At3g03040-like [Camelina sativa]|uniref:F-box protein At3g03040-like n=1 Tax=Camelina sativa TaxID=90675 RepID=A0ABM0VZW3_CAMSA|nr:PREDICTED: F-box protein At3g03040-like [Camelina sativa]XP_010463746.1 PREDICTED: F-box protein At3g03040-like [Camelina sativa]